jgi:hypothetical protein
MWITLHQLGCLPRLTMLQQALLRAFSHFVIHKVIHNLVDRIQTDVENITPHYDNTYKQNRGSIVIDDQPRTPKKIEYGSPIGEPYSIGMIAARPPFR